MQIKLGLEKLRVYPQVFAPKTFKGVMLKSAKKLATGSINLN